ncbi:MAG: 50S ribosomal protein L25 [Patescibacteria group bacterium]|uniref:Large ribosomal subunit protein bL25 n=1 Tax=candidate division WWE3 bacterium TaxID=2053526 RepID=A0A955J298_UNCKA|nr:50S ribosomal protein L25 [candidate division WWE3 bacterium]
MEIIATKRDVFGKKVKAFRKERKLPTVMFGKGLESEPLFVNLTDFNRLFAEAGETTLVDLKIEKESTQKVLIKEIQVHHITGEPIHAGFHKVDLTEKITADIPVTIIGEDENELVKSGEALVLTLLPTISVEALPADLPHEIKIDITNLLEIDSGITVAEITGIDKTRVEIVGIEDDELVIKLAHASMAEETDEEVNEADAIANIEATEETAEDKDK